MVPSRFEAFGLDAAFEGLFLFKQIDGHVAQDCKVFRSVVFAYSAVVFPERQVQASVQIVFDPPVSPNGFGDSGSVVVQAGDEIGRFTRQLSIDIACTGSHADGFNAGPLVFSLKPVDIIGSKIAPGFDAAMLSVDGLASVKRAVCRVLEEKGDILM